MFFIEYRDPLFGIIVFFMMIFVITFVSYWYKKLKREDDKKSLVMFLQKFESKSIDKNLKAAIQSKLLADKSWILVADAYLVHGAFEKAIEIYKALLENQPSAVLKREVLFLLGKTYFKAGFLERSHTIFLEILKQYPRSPEVLKYLLLVYEKLHKYKDALDVIEPMQAQNIDTERDKSYVELLMIMQCSDMESREKSEKLLAIYSRGFHLQRVIFEYLFRVDAELAWKHLDLSRLESLVDILWRLDKESCNFDIISKSAFLSELYSAKGYITTSKTSSVFEFNVLIHLEGKVDTTLGFEYLCTSCKTSSPFAFNRCMQCYTIDSLEVEYHLKSDVNESMYSF